MERPLTSWKEIAAHFNKSVRTVQRWEQQFGLPVRRPDAHDHGIVAAFPTELDTWMRTHLLVRTDIGNGDERADGVVLPERPLTRIDFSALRVERQRSKALVQDARTLVRQLWDHWDRLRLKAATHGRGFADSRSMQRQHTGAPPVAQETAATPLVGKADRRRAPREHLSPALTAPGDRKASAGT